MHSYLFHKKDCLVFARFHLFFVSLIIIVGCSVFAVYQLETKIKIIPFLFLFPRISEFNTSF